MLRIGIHLPTDIETLVSAKEAWKFKSAGLNVDLHHYFDDDWGVANALEDGNIDVAIVHTETALRDIGCFSQNPIIGFFSSARSNWSVVANSELAIQEVEDCFGSTFATFGPSSAVQINTEIFHRISDKPIRSIRYENMRKTTELIDAIANNRIDCVLLDTCRIQMVSERLSIRTLFTFTNDWPAKAIWVREELFENRVNELRQLLEILNTITAVSRTFDAREIGSAMELLDATGQTDFANYEPSDVCRIID